MEQNSMTSSALSFQPFLPLENFEVQSQKKVIGYLCILCKGVYNFPVLENKTEKTYCQECILKYYSMYKKYPLSDEIVENINLIPIQILENIINKQRIYCKNKILGCDFLGSVHEYRNHLSKSCLKEKIKCPLKGCNLEIYREFINEHLFSCDYRISKCIHCLQEMCFNKMHEHLQVCPKVEVDCPLKCNEKVKRENMIEHLNNACPNQLCSCPFVQYGCSFIQEPRFLLKKHLDNEKGHAFVVMDYLKFFEQKYEEKIKELEKRIEKIEKDNLHVSTEQKEIDNFLQKKRNYQYENNNNNINSNSNDLPISLPPDFTAEIQFDYTSIFDTSYINLEKFKVEGNIVKYIDTKGETHKFVFLNLPLLKNKKTSWEVKIKNTTTWFACGVCDKDHVIHNNLSFEYSNPQKNLGVFIISSNGSSWNYYVPEENLLPDIKRAFNKDDTIKFTFFPFKKELAYTFRNYKGKLTNVHQTKPSFVSNDTGLVPCLIFYIQEKLKLPYNEYAYKKSLSIIEKVIG